MKRKLMALLCACIMLSGCQSGSDPTVQTVPPTQAATETTVPTVSLMDQGETLAESPNLMYIWFFLFEVIQYLLFLFATVFENQVHLHLMK